jgi:hypothetical protein
MKPHTTAVQRAAQLGGIACAEKLTPEQRAEKASKAAEARWQRDRLRKMREFGYEG